MEPTRRDFLLGTTAAAAVGVSATAQTSKTAYATQPAKRPNIILYLADQMRWDFLQHNRLNPTPLTPNLDRMAQRGCNFTYAITNQPLCNPARSVLMTSRYATETGCWHNGIPLNNQKGKDLPTFAQQLSDAGYTTNLFGKWHLGHDARVGGHDGKVVLEDRGGFNDVWEGSNLLEFTTHPYEGTLWDRDGNEIKYKDQYRVDFITDRVVNHIKQKHDKPFFTFVSQLEPHHQNDMGQPIAPKGYKEKFRDRFVSPDLRALPGNWQNDLPDYYGCIKSIDESVGRIHQALEEQGIADNTVFIFMSDHGCHFKTRNGEYKRSPHNSSIRIPLIISGPGFDNSMSLDQLVGLIDVPPTILDIAGLTPPASMKGHSLVPLTRDERARASWENVQFVQISEAMTGRAVRTPEWTYVIEDRSADVKKDQGSMRYTETMLYNQFADPAEQTNLLGNNDSIEATKMLRALMLRKMEEAGEPRPEIVPYNPAFFMW
ncbi:MAG: sulfatase-like hydrolase/transferase [Acidobacteria bacterium]|nr:sulfatase-like hydrolase/transferase [Acidobacteriota bacterium]